MAAQLDQLYLYGGLSETSETRDRIELLLGRLRRQPLPSDQEWTGSTGHAVAIHARVVHWIVEYSSKPDGVGSDLYLCGACRIGMLHRPHGASLGVSRIWCSNCQTFNEA